MGFSVKRREAIHRRVRGLVRISTGKAIQWRGLGPFSESPDSENWKVAVLIPFSKINSESWSPGSERTSGKRKHTLEAHLPLNFADSPTRFRGQSVRNPLFYSFFWGPPPKFRGESAIWFPKCRGMGSQGIFFCFEAQLGEPFLRNFDLFAYGGRSSFFRQNQYDT